MKYLKNACRLLSVTAFISWSTGVIAAEVGNYLGDPKDTWDGLKQLGLEVKTFTQPNLIQPQETVLRRYLQYVPNSIKRPVRGKEYPLVILLPGADLSAEVGREWDWGDRVERLANKEKFYVVYANAHGSNQLTDANPNNPFFANGGYWRTCFGRPGADASFFTVDDSAYLCKVIAQVTADGLAVDSDRIYLMGMSNGGEMAQRAAREMTDVLAGVGAVMPVSGAPASQELATCKVQPQGPLAMMFIYSPQDTLLSTIYRNNGFDYAAIMSDSLKQWRQALGIEDVPHNLRFLPNRVKEGKGYKGSVSWAQDSVNSQIIRYDYPKTRAGADFSVLEINDAAGHAWPNSAPTPVDVAEAPYNGFRNQDINAEEVLWDFLKKSPRQRHR